ncbi:hypothetical protein ASPCADRAFT_209946 [Aspergillus carbonarius ITEM 5010]|uniref:Uncharacterized protein n=1 Tax=Aspergillus carbonarius (strain ITEM 5010) TaxID=602072 RepID=A0A1R3RDY5_ASPC5|nr:hypothetical protein ASPCADRAFT_209946 [Aspergillus carbonarius ITEM 5010]
MPTNFPRTKVNGGHHFSIDAYDRKRRLAISHSGSCPFIIGSLFDVLSLRHLMSVFQDNPGQNVTNKLADNRHDLRRLSVSRKCSPLFYPTLSVFRNIQGVIPVTFVFDSNLSVNIYRWYRMM